MRINPLGKGMAPRQDTSKWYLHPPQRGSAYSYNNIIAVGSIETNALQRLWTRPDAFAYDKLLAQHI